MSASREQRRPDGGFQYYPLCGETAWVLAELQHQQRLAEQRARREHAAVLQTHNRAVRDHERAVREYERALAAAERASAREQAAAERAAKEAHVAAQTAAAESLTAQALDSFAQIDSILAATLDVDDYVDISSLKQVVEHPPFPHGQLKVPTPAPRLEDPPPEPQFVAPPARTGLSKVFGKQKHAEASAPAHAAWKQQHQQWAGYVHQVLPEQNARLLEEHAKAERARADKLAAALAAYEAECATRERDVAEANSRVDAFRAALAAGDPEAINQYVGMVLGNSVYPEAFDVEHDYSFDPEFGELTVCVIVPPPSDLPAAKLYKFVAAADEIREMPCTQKEQRERYNSAVAAVAVRTFHEVFESDRERRIKTISLTVQTDAVNPATGLFETYPFVAAAADRDEFSQFDLANVDPAETLAHMRCSVSKNAFGLKPISTARGVR
jgi:restriction system protein